MIFYEHHIPPLTDGKWTFTAKQTLSHNDKLLDNSPTYTREQKLIITGSKLLLGNEAIHSVYPLRDTEGKYEHALAHVVLHDESLPWSRSLTSDNKIPWLLLIVIRKDEDVQLKMKPKELCDYKVPEGDIKATLSFPEIAVEKPEDVCVLLKLTAETFSSVVPSIDLLPFLAHCREEDGDINAVLMSNHRPKPPTDKAKIEYVAHIISLEGLEDYVGEKLPLQCKFVYVPSLYHWEFACVKDARVGFLPGAERLCKENPAEYWLRLQTPLPASNEANERLARGYVPLPYNTRTGETSFAWYRGPLIPHVPNSTILKYATADEAMILDTKHGVFDLSLASAFEIGRLLAISNATFCSNLLKLRLEFDNLIEDLSRYLVANDMNTISSDDAKEWYAKKEQAVSLEFLSKEDFKNVSWIDKESETQISTPSKPIPPTPEQIDSATKEAFQLLNAKLAGENTKSTVERVVNWLRGLVLLDDLPLNYLIPHQDLLPEENLRFFHIDTAWQSAMLDGALTIGNDQFLQEKLNGMLKKEVSLPPTSGFISNSRFNSDWPNFLIDPSPIRREIRYKNILLCLFDGTPSTITWTQPPVALTMHNIDNFLNEDQISKEKVVGLIKDPASFASDLILNNDSITFNVSSK